MRFAALFFLLMLAGVGPARPEPLPVEASLFCGLDPQIKERLCSGEAGPESLCGWLPILEALARGDFPSAETYLAELFEIERPLAARLLPLMGLALRPLDTDLRCLELQARRFLQIYQEAGYPGCQKQDPDQLLFTAYMIDVPPALLPAFEQDLEPAFLRPLVGRVGLSFRNLLELLSDGSVPPRHFSEQEFFEGITLGPLESGYVAKHEAEELRQIEKGLAELAAGQIAEGRQRLQALAVSKPPLFAIRAAFALARAGFLLEAQPLLENARDELALRGGGDPLNLYSAVLAGWLEAWVLMELGQPAESRRALAELEVIEDPTVRAFLAMLPRPSPEGIGSHVFEGLDIPAFIELASGMEGTASAPALRQTLEAIQPSFHRGKPRAPESDPAPSELDIWLLLDRRDCDAALAAAEIFILQHPKYRHVKIFLMIAAGYNAQGRNTQAREVLERAASLLEEKLGPYQDDDMARSFIDSQVYSYFATAVEFASWWGEEGWSYAERARAFTLRRLLGESRPSAGATDFPGRWELEKSIAKIERSPLRDRNALAELHRRFESARLRQKLRQASLALPVAEAPPRVRREEYADSREIYLIYFDTLGKISDALGTTERDPQRPFAGRLWIWVIAGEGLAQVPANLSEEDWASLGCLTQALRWQSAGERVRRAAADRGVEILAACPGAAPGLDPAAELYRILVAPIAALLPAGRRLVVVPHSKLNGIPFAALRNPRTGRRLAEDFELATVPSLDVLTRLRHRGDKGR